MENISTESNNQRDLNSTKNHQTWIYIIAGTGIFLAGILGGYLLFANKNESNQLNRTASTTQVSPTISSNITPTLDVTPTTSQPIPTPIVIWQSNDQKVNMVVGQTLSLTFNRGVQGSYQDFVTSTNNKQVLNLQSNTVDSKGIWTAVYKAMQPGQGIITTTGTPECLQESPACNYPITTFKLTIAVN